MREIRFRCWDEQEIIGMSEPFDFIDSPIWINDPLGKYPNKRGKIMQFTGLKDKNGKEIYEGDVVKYKNSIWQVRFNSGQFNIFANLENLSEAIMDKPKTDNEALADELDVWWTRSKVIGNIYENPKLLEVKR